MTPLPTALREHHLFFLKSEVVVFLRDLSEIMSALYFVK